MTGFLWGLGIGCLVGAAVIGRIFDALIGDDDGFCHCLEVRNTRTTTDGTCDTCGRMVNVCETSLYGPLSSRTERR